VSGGVLAFSMCPSVQPVTLLRHAIKIVSIFEEIESGVIHMVMA